MPGHDGTPATPHLPRLLLVVEEAPTEAPAQPPAPLYHVHPSKGAQGAARGQEQQELQQNRHPKEKKNPEVSRAEQGALA